MEAISGFPKGHATTLAAELLAKSNQIEKDNGKATNKLLESAAEVAKHANLDAHKGKLVDLHA